QVVLGADLRGDLARLDVADVDALLVGDGDRLDQADGLEMLAGEEEALAVLQEDLLAGGVGAGWDLGGPAGGHGDVAHDSDVQADVLAQAEGGEDTGAVLLDEALHRFGKDDRRPADVLALAVGRQQDAVLAVEEGDGVADVLAVL